MPTLLLLDKTIIDIGVETFLEEAEGDDHLPVSNQRPPMGAQPQF